MRQINIQAAKTHLSRLVEQAAAGEEIFIAKAGKAMAKLGPMPKKRRKPRTLGGWEGKVWIGPGFDAADKDIEKLFYGSEIFPAEAKRKRRTRK